jgi:hypothetical protein
VQHRALQRVVEVGVGNSQHGSVQSISARLYATKTSVWLKSLPLKSSGSPRCLANA